MLNLFQHPSCPKEQRHSAKWILKQVQDDGRRACPQSTQIAGKISFQNRISSGLSCPMEPHRPTPRPMHPACHLPDAPLSRRRDPVVASLLPCHDPAVTSPCLCCRFAAASLALLPPIARRHREFRRRRHWSQLRNKRPAPHAGINSPLGLVATRRSGYMGRHDSPGARLFCPLRPQQKVA
jgi:hypothetical protein